MMYSSAPACMARAMWEMSFSVVQNTTLGFARRTSCAVRAGTGSHPCSACSSRAGWRRASAMNKRTAPAVHLQLPISAGSGFPECGAPLCDHHGIVDDEDLFHYHCSLLALRSEILGLGSSHDFHVEDGDDGIESAIGGDRRCSTAAATLSGSSTRSASVTSSTSPTESTASANPSFRYSLATIIPAV